MSICPNCGTETSDCNLCERCGASLSTSAERASTSLSVDEKNLYAYGSQPTTNLSYVMPLEIPRTIFDAYRICFQEKYCKVEDRASRSEFWFFFLLNFLISTPLLFAYIYCILNAEFLSDMIVRLGMIAWVMFCIYFLIMFIPSVCVYVRRLHDCGHDGLILTLWFVPIINIILFFYFALRPGVNGPNQYGPKPKRRD